jgi:tetratricopeptide (TPR) repeat protein
VGPKRVLWSAISASWVSILLTLSAVLCMEGQGDRSGREAAILDDMLCRGDYVKAFKLANRDFQDPTLDKLPLVPYMGALLVEAGNLQAADKLLSPRFLGLDTPLCIRVALTRERAALMLARGDYKASAAQGIEAYNFAIQDNVYASRRAYTGSIAAEALLRSGDIVSARQYLDLSLKAVPKRARKASFFIPRVFYTACLVASYSGSTGNSESTCLRGLAMAASSGKPNRDLSLGYLVLAEVRLRAGKLQASRADALESLVITKALFGETHQDTVKALELMSLADFKIGKVPQAQTEARGALALAATVFGADSKRSKELAATLRDVIH